MDIAADHDSTADHVHLLQPQDRRRHDRRRHQGLGVTPHGRHRQATTVPNTDAGAGAASAWRSHGSRGTSSPTRPGCEPARRTRSSCSTSTPVTPTIRRDRLRRIGPRRLAGRTACLAGATAGPRARARPRRTASATGATHSTSRSACSIRPNGPRCRSRRTLADDTARTDPLRCSGATSRCAARLVRGPAVRDGTRDLRRSRCNGAPIGDDVLAPGWTQLPPPAALPDLRRHRRCSRDGDNAHRRDRRRRLVPRPPRLPRRTSRALRRPDRP